MDWNETEDLALVDLIRSGDESALAELIRRYMPLIYKTTTLYYLPDGEFEDLVQWGRIGVWEAAMAFIPSFHGDWIQNERTFPIFVKMVVERKMITAVKTSNRQKQMPVNGFADLAHIPEPADLTADRLDSWSLLISVLRVLTPLERRALCLFLYGYSYEEAEVIMGCSHKTFDNAMQRVRRKAKALVMAN